MLRRVRRLPGWFGRMRPARYAALRVVWHAHYGYSGSFSLRRRPTAAYIAAAEYAYHMGTAAMVRQAGPRLDTHKVERAVRKRNMHEQSVLAALRAKGRV